MAVEDYLNKGYLTDSLLNFIATLGWNPTADREIYNIAELAEMFELDKVNNAGAKVNFSKLNWLNSHYIRALPRDKYLELAATYLNNLTEDTALMDRVALLVKERVEKLSDLPDLTKPYLNPNFKAHPSLIPWKTQTKEQAKEKLEMIKSWLLELPENAWHDVNQLETFIKNKIMVNVLSNGEILWPLRVSLSGEKQSPGPFELLSALGTERSLARLDAAINVLVQM